MRTAIPLRNFRCYRGFRSLYVCMHGRNKTDCPAVHLLRRQRPTPVQRPCLSNFCAFFPVCGLQRGNRSLFYSGGASGGRHRYLLSPGNGNALFQPACYDNAVRRRRHLVESAGVGNTEPDFNARFFDSLSSL